MAQDAQTKFCFFHKKDHHNILLRGLYVKKNCFDGQPPEIQILNWHNNTNVSVICIS